jgi:hypothetical protein
MKAFELLHKISMHVPTTPASRLGRSAAPFTKGGSKSQCDVVESLRELQK